MRTAQNGPCIPAKNEGGKGKRWERYQYISPVDDSTRKKKKIPATTTFMMERQHLTMPSFICVHE